MDLCQKCHFLTSLMPREGNATYFRGVCSLRKAKLTGSYDDRYMTWMDKQRRKIGHAQNITRPSRVGKHHCGHGEARSGPLQIHGSKHFSTESLATAILAIPVASTLYRLLVLSHRQRADAGKFVPNHTMPRHKCAWVQHQLAKAGSFSGPS